MAIYEVKIPDERLQFILELFNRLEFVNYQVAKAEPRVYIAEDLINKHSKAEVEKEEEYDREAELKKIRETIERLQEVRTSPKDKITTFRFPNGDPQAAQEIKDHETLVSVVENYFRTNVARLEYEPIGKDKKFEMDVFVVMAVLTDNNNQETKLKAGFISKNLSM